LEIYVSVSNFYVVVFTVITAMSYLILFMTMQSIMSWDLGSNSSGPVEQRNC